MKSIKLNFSGFYITGTSDVTPWGGGNACIEMAPFTVKHLREIRDNLNDSGFGVESINGAICDIWANHEGYHTYLKNITLGNVSESTFDYYCEN